MSTVTTAKYLRDLGIGTEVFRRRPSVAASYPTPLAGAPSEWMVRCTPKTGVVFPFHLKRKVELRVWVICFSNVASYYVKIGAERYFLSDDELK